MGAMYPCTDCRYEHQACGRCGAAVDVSPHTGLMAVLGVAGDRPTQQVDDLAVQRALLAFGADYQLSVQVGGQSQEHADDGFGHDGSVHRIDTSLVSWYHSDTKLVPILGGHRA